MLNSSISSGFTSNTIVPPGKTLEVGTSGTKYSSIKAAMDSITDNTSTNPYTITVSPGVYSENNPIQCKQFVSIRSTGGSFVTSIVARNANQNMFDMSGFCVIRGFNVAGVSGTGFAFSMLAAGTSSILDCIDNECSNGILLNNINGILNILTHGEFNSLTTSTIGICILAGNATIDKYVVSGASTIGTLINISGANSIATIHDIQSFSPNVTTGLFIQDGARVVINTSSLVGMTDGLVLEGGANVRANVLTIFNAQQDGVRLNDVGSNTQLSITGTVLDSTRYDLNILSATATLTGTGNTSIDNLNFVPGAALYGAIIDDKEDDEGFNIIGELHNGLPEAGSEAVFGEGDSYTRGMLVYTESAGGAFTDVSIEARSASGSTFTFPGIAADNAIYLASSLNNASDVLEHYGIKAKVDTAAVLGAGEIIIEYWNGAAWTEINGMEVDSTNQYFPHAKNYFQDTGSHHIRYNCCLVTDSWIKNDPITPAIGTDYYWIRLRIKTGVTSVPIFQQFKLHTNRFEINADGWVEYFGKARPIGQLNFSFALGRPFEGNMQSQDLYVSENVGIGGNINKFTATGDKLGLSGFLPFDCDTSSPLRLVWSGHANGTDTIGWTVQWAWVTEGDVLTYGEPGVSPNSGSVIISKAVTVDKVSIFEANLDISNMLSRRDGAFGDELWISITPTTLPDNFTLAGSQITYTKWCEGGHI